MGRPPVTQALVLEGFLSRLSFGLLTFALPLYGRRLGLSIVEIGLLSSLAQTVSLVLKPVMGGAADRWGLRRSLVGALVIRSLLCLSYALTTVPWQIFAVRGAHGVSDSLRDPAVHALIAENGGKKSMACAFAWYQTAKTAAGSVGKSVAGVLLATAGGFGLTFEVAFALSLLPVVAVLWLVPRDVRGQRADSMALARPAPDKASAPATPQGDGRGAGAKPPGVLSFAGLGFLVAGTSSMLTSLFPIIATEYAGLSTAQAGLGWGRGPPQPVRRAVLPQRGEHPLGLRVPGLPDPGRSLGRQEPGRPGEGCVPSRLGISDGRGLRAGQQEPCPGHGLPHLR